MITVTITNDEDLKAPYVGATDYGACVLLFKWAANMSYFQDESEALDEVSVVFVDG